MECRQLGRTDMRVSAISFGAWAIGSTWGPVDDEVSMRALHAAVDAGTNFIDTADVYGDGRSERLVARLRRERRGEVIYVATKAGRRLPRQAPEGYSRENLNAWVDRSLKNLEMDAVDLLQLHCPHPAVYDRPEVFGYLDELVSAGKIRHYRISVETVDEALRGTRHPGVKSVQIIFKLLRLKPAEQLFPVAMERELHDPGSEDRRAGVCQCRGGRSAAAAARDDGGRAAGLRRARAAAGPRELVVAASLSACPAWPRAGPPGRSRRRSTCARTPSCRGPARPTSAPASRGRRRGRPRA
jgi:hypothetical protein